MLKAWHLRNQNNLSLEKGKNVAIVKPSEVKNKKIGWYFSLHFSLTEQRQPAMFCRKQLYTASNICFPKEQSVVAYVSTAFLQGYKEKDATLISCDTQLASIRPILSALADR